MFGRRAFASFISFLPFSCLALPSSDAKPQSIRRRAVAHDGTLFQQPDIGGFTSYKSFTFESGQLPSELYPSSYTVNDKPLGHVFEPSNVYVANGFLNLKVPGGQTSGPVSSAEVETTFHDIKYASVSTYAILANAPGVCSGMFFYLDNENEIDIEFLSDPNSKANPGNGQTPLQLTNQAHAGGIKSYSTVPLPANAFTTVHEYRIDWVADSTMFYIDGTLVKRYDTNVPTVPGTWLWNNWANGDIQWSGGPPAQDNILKIQSIEMFFNQTG